MELLPDDHIALFQALSDLGLGRGLDAYRDWRAAGAVALTDFDEAATLKRPDRRRWQPQHVLLALQDHMNLHYRAWREPLSVGVIHCEARGVILPLNRAAAPGTNPC